MKPNFRLKLTFFFALFVFSSPKVFSQCFQIESILVDACDSGTDEGLNEMVRFKVGNTAINTSNISVNWPNNAWQGIVQNALTTTKVATLNAQITTAGGCGQLIQPVGGVLPANAKVILVSSYNFNIALNSFGAITENIYILFQNNATTTTGHFGNYNATPGTRTLTISFGACSDTVTYERSLLVNINGTNGGSAALNDGSTVNFSATGTPTYVNHGCIAPVDIFEVNAGTTPLTACPGTTIALSATATGYTSLVWTALSGSFSASGSLNTNYTISPSASGAIVLTLTATNSCGQTRISTITINVGGNLTPTFNTVAPICAGGNLAALPMTSLNGVVGVWSPALNANATTTYTFTPNAGQCASTATLVITVNPIVTPIFNPVLPICSGAALAALPLISTNGITGNWSPVLNTTATTTYTFTPTAGQCAATATLVITVNPVIVPTFNTITPICSGLPLTALPTTSLNGITGTWSPALNNTTTTVYTFTPNAGQCGTIVTTTITIIPAIIPTFNAVTAICAGQILSPLPTTSLNGITGTWSPALNNTTTTAYTFTPNTGQCATTATLTITVNPASTTPTFNAVPAICSGGNLSPLPTTSINLITGTWSPALNNTATTTYTFTPNAGQCATTATLTITVNDGFDVQIIGGCVNKNFVLQAHIIDELLDENSVDFDWQYNGVSIGTNDPNFNVSAYLKDTPAMEEFPLTLTLNVSSNGSCSKSGSFVVESIYCDIQKGISPNGDAKNDFFDLAMLDVKQLQIFNRYGTKVYSQNEYKDQWHGQSTNGDELPDATYYYVIEFKNPQPSKTGWIYINR